MHTSPCVHVARTSPILRTMSDWTGSESDNANVCSKATQVATYPQVASVARSNLSVPSE